MEPAQENKGPKNKQAYVLCIRSGEAWRGHRLSIGIANSA